jgi:hypothetical protein
MKGGGWFSKDVDIGGVKVSSKQAKIIMSRDPNGYWVPVNVVEKYPEIKVIIAFYDTKLNMIVPDYESGDILKEINGKIKTNEDKHLFEQKLRAIKGLSNFLVTDNYGNFKVLNFIECDKKIKANPMNKSNEECYQTGAFKRITQEEYNRNLKEKTNANAKMAENRERSRKNYLRPYQEPLDALQGKEKEANNALSTLDCNTANIEQIIQEIEKLRKQYEVEKANMMKGIKMKGNEIAEKKAEISNLKKTVIYSNYQGYPNYHKGDLEIERDTARAEALSLELEDDVKVLEELRADYDVKVKEKQEAKQAQIDSIIQEYNSSHTNSVETCGEQIKVKKSVSSQVQTAKRRLNNIASEYNRSISGYYRETEGSRAGYGYRGGKRKSTHRHRKSKRKITKRRR